MSLIPRMKTSAEGGVVIRPQNNLNILIINDLAERVRFETSNVRLAI